MEPLRLKPRRPIEEVVEDWDDEDFMIGEDEDLTFRSQSASSIARNTSHSRRRDSRSSFRSDRESLPGDERQVHLPGDDEKSTLDAIAAAAHAGIPIPINVPPSALVGGTIKRLGARKMKKISQEDWGDDLELPAPGQALRLKPQDGNRFPEALRQVSGSTSPRTIRKSFTTIPPIPPPQIAKRNSLGAPINLEKFRDMDDDDDDGLFGGGTTAMQAPRLQARGRPLSLITPPTPSPTKRRSKNMEEDDFENDLELPSDGKLKLCNRKEIPKTPSLHMNEDFDWGEGSLGTRFGGTRRDAFSTLSSSVSAMSPSLASSFTAESEDELLDGLILPMGPLDLGGRLERRKESRSPIRPELRRPQDDKRPSSPKISSPTRFSPKRSSPKPIPIRHGLINRALQTNREEEDLVSGLDLGEGNVFRYAKPTVHRNVKVKEARPASPVRPKAAVSLTFTNKPTNLTSSRIPRPMVNHERSHTQSSLEPVSESGGPIPPKPPRRPQSRLSGHSAHSSISSIHTPLTPTSAHPIFPSPRRNELSQKVSVGVLRSEPTTTNAQLLRLKRSLPAMRHGQSPAKHAATRSDRPPSRGDPRADVFRPQSSIRPKTPVERPRSLYETSAAQARKGQVPFLPAGASQSQSHHITARNSRSFRRHDPEQGPEARPSSRAHSRNALRSPSPKRSKNEKATPEPIWQQISKPRRVRHFGDGHELDAFDDLPTSAQVESRYIKQPLGSGNKTSIRNKLYQNVLPDRKTPSPISSYASSRFVDNLPRFARDTAASRIARETSLAQRAQPTGPLVPLTSQRVAQLSTRSNLNPPISLNHGRPKKSRRPPQLKPHLISNLSSAKDSKVINGMRYNPATFRWEGNENVLNAFDAPASTPSTTPVPHPTARDRDAATPRPLLITNINTKKEIRRMGDMVFDPEHMCWLEIKSTTPHGPQPDDPMAGFAALEEEDPFKDIPDLNDKVSTTGAGRASDIREDWLVGEEFDVGPEFVRRQHEEEARWRRKCEKWTGKTSRNRADWRWAIRDIVMQTP
jgi:hypothetical protein